MTNIIKKDNRQPATFGSIVDQIFHNNLGRVFDDAFWGFQGLQGRNQLPVNVRETDKSYEMEIIAPGWRKEEITLNVTGDMLTVAFAKKEQSGDEVDKKTWLRKEYSTGAFSRNFMLDDSVNGGAATATYQDGVLYVSLPKKEAALQPSRTIQVQ